MQKYADNFRISGKKIIFYTPMFFIFLYPASHYYRFDTVLQKIIPCNEQTYQKSEDMKKLTFPEKNLEKITTKEFIISITPSSDSQDFEQECKKYIQTCPDIFFVEITYSCKKNNITVVDVEIIMGAIVSWCTEKNILPENIMKNISFDDNFEENYACVVITFFSFI